MRIISLVFLLMLAGCGTITPMAELEHQALLTGDWTEVEKRERLLQRRKSRAGIQCPAGYMGYCESRLRIDECSCVRSDVMRRAFSGLQH